MSHNTEVKNWLRLFLSDRVGPVTFSILLSHYKTAEEALRRLPECAKKGGAKKELHPASEKQAEEQLLLAEQTRTKILLLTDPSYPTLLKQIYAPPPILFVRGDTTLLNKKSIAIVGTRHASLNGRNLARKLAFDLAKNGINIVSGMARGIDAASHMGALATHNGHTTGVLGTSVDEIYPLENKLLYEEIHASGCLVSEFPFRTPLTPSNFPRRNRIISGLSLGTVVIEAQAKSGSLITAKEALNQNREVFAVPGSPIDPRSEGPNLLLKQGAILVRNATDILNELDTPINVHDQWETTDTNFVALTDNELEKARKQVEEILNPDPVFVDDLARACGLPIAVINIILVELELAGRLRRSGGNRVSLIYN